jgi:two-component system cell cycle response regulator DivK
MATILLIEDDQNSANIVTRVLMRHEHKVIHASEGITGLKIAGDQTIDLVLLDLGLPDIGGHTIAALINRLPGDIPIVAVTASTDPVTQRRAMTYGCSGYITKPINTRTFIEEVEGFMHTNGQLATQDEADDAPAKASDAPAKTDDAPPAKAASAPAKADDAPAKADASANEKSQP